MGYRDLHFEPAVGTEGARIRHVETHLVRTGAILSADRDARDADALNQSRRVSKLEGRMQGMLVWVGAQKVRWATVAFVISVATAVATALICKALGAL